MIREHCAVRPRRPSVVATIAVGLGVLAAACGGAGGGRDGDEDVVYGGGTVTTVAGDDGEAPGSSVPAAGAPTTTARRAPATTTTSRRRASVPTTTSSVPSVVEGAPGSGDVQPTPASDGYQGPPGAFARTLLRPRPATSIVLERSSERGAAVSEAAVNRSADVVRTVTGKNVSVRPTCTLAAGDGDWTADEVRRAADAAAQVAQGEGRAVVRILFLRGAFEGSSEVLGVAVRGDVVALFVDSIAGAATPLVSRQALEDAVLLHELGHVLGLVDLARNTGRADPENPGHSSNRGSVMYWAVDSSLVGQVLNGPPPRDFDAADLADLRALREGA